LEVDSVETLELVELATCNRWKSKSGPKVVAVPRGFAGEVAAALVLLATVAGKLR